MGDFHVLHYYNVPSRASYWQGYPINKCVFDIWNIQELVFKLKPDFFIETGTSYGGMSLFIANVMDVLGKGMVITIDVKDKTNIQHSKITRFIGSSTDPKIFKSIKKMISVDTTVMVDLDSDHSKDHVLAELRLYGPLVTKGFYMICEDTNTPDAMKGLQIFLKENPKQWVVDVERTYRYLLTFNAEGYLIKK